MKQIANISNMSNILLSESYIYESLREYSKMYNVLKKSVLLDDSNTKGMERLMYSVELNKNFIESINLHTEIIDKSPYNATAWYNLGHSYGFVGEYEHAITALEYAFIIKPEMEAAYLDCAELCLQLKKYDKALQIYEEANKTFGPDSELFVYIAECQIHLNKLSDAKHSLFNAVSIDPYNDEIYYFLGKTYALEQNWFSAINSFHKAISIEDGREEYHNSIAKSLAQIGKFTEAISHFEESTEVAPENAQYWFDFVHLLTDLGEFGKALDILNEAEENSFDCRLVYARAACLFLFDKKPEAFNILNDVLAENFDMHDALFEINANLKFDKDILSIIEYYRGENIG